jgi:hypothetical protein
VKITNKDSIEKGEKALINAITSDLDWDGIERVFKNRYNLELKEDVEYRRGDLVVHDKEIAYKLEFDVKVKLSILFDRNGNYLSLESSNELKPTSKPAAAENITSRAPKIDTALHAPLMPAPAAASATSPISAAASAPSPISAAASAPSPIPIPTPAAVPAPEAAHAQNAGDTGWGGFKKKVMPIPMVDPGVKPKENITLMASQIAEMISDINEPDSGAK